MYRWRVFLLSRKNIFDNKFSIKMFELTFCFLLPQNHPGNEIPFTPHIITSFQREEGRKAKRRKLFLFFRFSNSGKRQVTSCLGFVSWTKFSSVWKCLLMRMQTKCSLLFVAIPEKYYFIIFDF